MSVQVDRRLGSRLEASDEPAEAPHLMQGQYNVSPGCSQALIDDQGT
jgi:hypothetical protein